MSDESTGQDSADVLVDVRSVVKMSSDPRTRPTPHGNKLNELLNNNKLPRGDVERVENSLREYDHWIESMSALKCSGDEKVAELVRLLNEYKRQVEVNLIWDSSSEFLYRQKGQLKLDNSILEEWFPWLVDIEIIPELKEVELFAGPAKAFAASYFQSSLANDAVLPMINIRSKDQDFTIGRPTYLSSSFDDDFPDERTERVTTYLAYIAAEIKTNLDKTMFQEASATSHDLSMAVPGSHYFLICEYLDMTPISSAGTDISEVLILRGKRMGSQTRKNYSNPAYRTTHRQEYINFLDEHPIRVDVVKHFISNIRSILQNQTQDLSEAVERGYF